MSRAENARPCRVGTRIMATLVNRIVDGEGRMEDLDQISRLGETILKSSKCNLWANRA